MFAFLVFIWFVLGILALHIAVKADENQPLPSPWVIWLTVAGPFALLAIFVVCVGIAIEKRREL